MKLNRVIQECLTQIKLELESQIDTENFNEDLSKRLDWIQDWLDTNVDYVNMPYKEYLKTDHWQRVSILAKENADNKCQLCNGEGVLHTHHRTYENLGHEKYNDLIVLCQKCHEKFHNRRPQIFIPIPEKCPVCGSKNIRDKGSWDKCMDCGQRIISDQLRTIDE